MRSEYIRSTQPAGPPTPKLRLLGTTWYRRGPSYWARRAWLTFAYLVLLALVALFVGALVAAVVSGMAGVGRIIVLALIVAVVVASYVQAIRARRRRHRERDAAAALTAEQRRAQARRQRAAGGAGLGAGVGASGGSVVGAALLFLGALAVVGTISVIVVESLGRYLNDEERAAVQAVAAWRERQPDGPA